MSRVTPSRFWAKSSCKMGSFSGRREKKKSFLNFILMEKWDFRVVLLLMRSFFAWLAIKASNLPIMKLEMFHLYSQMDFFKLLLADCFFLLSFFLFSFFLFLSFPFLSISLSFPFFPFLFVIEELACDRVPSAFHVCIFHTKYNYFLNYKLDKFAT